MPIIDITQLKESDSSNADVCVIGTGPGGASVAIDLASKGYNVLILETGSNKADSVFEKYIEQPLNFEKIASRFGFSRQFGGTSNLWAGRTAPLEGVDFSKTGNELSSWPITNEDLMPFYQCAADIIGIEKPEYIKQSDGIPLPPEGWSSLFSEEGLDLKRFQWCEIPFNTADYLAKHSLKLDGLTICIGAHVMCLIENEEKTNVEKISVIENSGRIIDIRAKVFIVAAGGIETPRILLNSTNQRSTGIGNDYGQVGRYFSTHPKMNAAKLLLKSSVFISNPLYMDFTVDKMRLRDGIGFSQKKVVDSIKLNHYVQLSPALEQFGMDKLDSLNSGSFRGGFLFKNLSFVHKYVAALGKRAYNLIGRLGIIQRKTKVFTLRAFFDQYPHPDNRIKLSTEKDQYGQYKSQICWEFKKKDRESVICFFEELNAEFQASGIGEVDYSVLKSSDDWGLIDMHSHFMGTTRMGKDPLISVTDENCKVHGMSNLYISGPSLFPTYGYANPFYTIFALGLRLSTHIDQEKLAR